MFQRGTKILVYFFEFCIYRNGNTGSHGICALGVLRFWSTSNLNCDSNYKPRPSIMVTMHCSALSVSMTIMEGVICPNV